MILEQLALSLCHCDLENCREVMNNKNSTYDIVDSSTSKQVQLDEIYAQMLQEIEVVKWKREMEGKEKDEGEKGEEKTEEKERGEQ